MAALSNCYGYHIPHPKIGPVWPFARNKNKKNLPTLVLEKEAMEDLEIGFGHPGREPRAQIAE